MSQSSAQVSATPPTDSVHEQLRQRFLTRGHGDDALESWVRRLVREELAEHNTSAVAAAKPAMNLELAKAIEQGFFTDRDLLNALFSLVAGLAERLTGKMVVVSIRNKHGHRTPIGADPERVMFLER
jgi:hypothetical protein